MGHFLQKGVYIWELLNKVRLVFINYILINILYRDEEGKSERSEWLPNLHVDENALQTHSGHMVRYRIQ